MNPCIFSYYQINKSTQVWRRIESSVIFILFLGTWLSAQNLPIKGKVISQNSGEGIPFASISWKKAGFGRVCDSAGCFILYPRYTHDTLIVSHVGYNTLYLPIEVGQGYDPIFLSMTEKKTSEVQVNKKYNRGLVWWKKLVLHKVANDPGQYSEYAFDLYKKVEVDLTNITKEGFGKIKALKPFQFLLTNLDSNSEDKSFLPVFMKETMSVCLYRNNPPEKTEEIKAIRTSGLKNEVVLHFIDGLKQEIDVYANSLILFGKEFISPISSDATSFYDFKAADTQYINGQRFLHLLFSPKHEGENAFTGDCWIHYSTWALSSINLKISGPVDINYVNRLSIKQEFMRTKDSVWVFSKNQFIAEVAALAQDKIAFIVRQTSIFRHIRTSLGEVPITLVKYGGGDEVFLDDSAKERSMEFWDQNRPEHLSANEQNVYKMVDTLNNMTLFKKYRNAADFLISGRKKLGDIEIGPWYKWISTNQVEIVRLRFDLGTTEQFNKSLYVHGYLAYGTGDNQFNGGIDFKYRIPGKGGYSLNGHCLHDLNNGGSDKGGVGLTKDNMFSQLFRKPGVLQKYYHVDEYYLGLGKEWTSRFSVNLFLTRGSYQTYAPLPPQKILSANQVDIFNMEAGVNLRYAPGEKKITTYRKEYRFRENKPVFELDYARGLPGIFGSMYEYDKIFAQISQTIRLPRWGTVSYRAYGGRIRGEALPFMLLEVHTGNDIFYYSKQSFNLMNRFEYLSDQYAGFSIEHDFEKKLINLLPFLRRTKIRQFWNLKAVWGDLSRTDRILNCRENSGYAMQSLKGGPYIEMGTGLDNVLRYFRIDLIWRLSPTPSPSVVIPSANYQIPAAQFGIFGSFQIQF